MSIDTHCIKKKPQQFYVFVAVSKMAAVAAVVLVQDSPMLISHIATSRYPQPIIATRGPTIKLSPLSQRFLIDSGSWVTAVRGW